MAALNLSLPGQHFDRIHEAQRGVTLLWEQELGRWPKIRPGDPSASGLLASQIGEVDRFITVNEFDGWRLVRLLRSLRACFVDIDPPEGEHVDLQTVLDAVSAARIPSPSFVVHSGRGLHCYWPIEATPASCLPVWQRVQDEIIKALRVVGADPSARDCTRVLRLVGSINGKNGATVRGRVLSDAVWRLDQLAAEVLPESSPRAVASRKSVVRDLSAASARTGKRKATGSIYARWRHVYADLCRIGDHYKRLGGIPVGHRDTWLFLVAVSLSWFASGDALTAEVEHHARGCAPSLPEAQVRKIAAGATDRAERAAAGEVVMWNGRPADVRYKFKCETLWAWIGPLVPDEMIPSMRAIIPEQTRADRKKERDAARHRDSNTGRGVRASNAAQADRARGLLAQGVSISAVARELGVSRPTIKRWSAR